MSMMKRMLSLLLALALLVGNVPAVAFAEETEIPAETEMVAAEETLASTEAATEPAEATVAPTEVVTEPAEGNVLGESVPDSTSSSAIASGTCGKNLTWVLDKEGTLTISGSGAMTDFGLEGAPWYDYRDSIKNVVMEYGPTNIGAYAFYKCSNLANITIANTVGTIGNYAFYRCNSLSNIDFPNNVTRIEKNAFAQCGGLTSITIPRNVSFIGVHAFSGNPNLKSIILPSNMTKIDNNAFAGTGVTSICIPRTSLGENVFYGCNSLESVTISQGVSAIPAYTFYDCPSLSRISIPGSVSEIGSYAFGRCAGLRDVYIADHSSWCLTNFDGSYSNPAEYDVNLHFVDANGNEVTDVVLHNSVTEIPNYAFKNSNLRSIVLPESVTYIGIRSFENCSNLEHVSILGEISGISSYTFQNCSSLTSIALPASMTMIGGDAFAGCPKLTDVYFGGSQSAWAALKNGPRAEYFHYYCSNPKNHWETIDVKATCTTDGVTSTSCDCGYERDKVVYPALGHDMGEWELIREADCDDDGLKRKNCNRCEYVEEEVIERLGCDWCEWVITKEATCTENGRKYTVCNRCGSEWKEVIKASHAFQNGVCIVCQLMGGSCGVDVQWVLDDAGTLTISGIGDMKNYDNYQDSYAPWKNYQNAILSVVIKDGVTSIGADAFRYCSELSSVKIFHSVKTIGSEAFRYCYSLKNIELPSSINDIGAYAFSGCNSLEDFVIPYNVVGIERAVFSGCTSLRSIYIPYHPQVTGFYKDTFQNCYNLTEIYYGGTKDQWMGITSNRPYVERMHYSVLSPEIHWKKNSAESTTPTCTEVGYIYENCACGYTRSRIVDALGHDMGEWVAVTDPTCTESGLQRRNCLRCDHFEEKAIPETGHTEIITNAVAPTCTKTGLTQGKHCSVCGEVLVAQETVLANGHSYESEATPPTYTKDGYTTYTCSVCGATYMDDHVDALGLPKPAVKASKNAVTGGGILTWEHDGEADYYKIYRATGKNGKYKLLETVEGTEVEVKVSAGKTYYYKVKAICTADSDLNSSYSSVVKVTGKCAQPEITVEAKTSTGKPFVDWAKVSGAKKYYVYRATSLDGTYKKVKTTTSTSYTDKSAKVGVEYFYKVKAVASKSTYNGAYSEIKSCLTVCARPEVELSVNKTTGKPVIEWEKITGAVSYEIYRSENSGEYELISTQTELTYTDENTVVDGAYSYKVKAIANDPALNSAESAAETITAVCAKPKASIALDGKKPMVSWDPVEGATKYYVYRSTKKSSGYKKVATVEEGESYRDSKAKKGTTYYYKIVAVSENTKSAYSNVVKIKSK